MRTITARVAYPGIHHWPNAPDHRSYLRVRHRHLFKAAITVRVAHDDRAVEFHDLADDLLAALLQQGTGEHGILVDFGPKSCEALAVGCVELLTDRYDIRTCTVSEDGENDATWEAQ